METGMSKDNNYSKADIANEVKKTAELWKNQFGELFITIKLDENRHKHYPLKSSHAKAYITKALMSFGVTNKLKQNVENILAQLEAEAFLNDVEYETNLRVAGHNGSIYIHLRDKEDTIIEVDAEGWRKTQSPPVRFVETQHLKALPYPIQNGKIEDIDQLLNVESVQDRNMILSWAFNALFPTGPYPILMLIGQQGSAKTTTTKLIRSLVDPAKPLTRSLPNSDRNLMVAAANNWIMSYDNLSGLSKYMSDSLCRLATGSGMGIRANYSDKEEIVFDASLPIILNGIENSALRLDLLDRCIVIPLPTISPEKRKSGEEILALQKIVLPSVFGALLDALSEALKRLPEFETPYLPRMADFAKRVLSVETLLGWQEGEFLPYFEELMDDATFQAMEGDIVLQGILQFMNGKEEWSGTASELRERIRDNTQPENRKYIPAPNKLGLKRIKPALDKFNIEYEFIRNSSGRIHSLRNLNPTFDIDVTQIKTVLTLEEAVKMKV